MDTPKDLISLSEARRLINVSQNKIAELVAKGFLKSYTTPLDRRKKLVSKADVLALRKPRAEAA